MMLCELKVVYMVSFGRCGMKCVWFVCLVVLFGRFLISGSWFGVVSC